MKKAKPTRTAKTFGPTKAELEIALDNRTKELEWAMKLIGQMQGEIRNVVALNVSLTESVRNLSRKVD
jgi:hypothetical protein